MRTEEQDLIVKKVKDIFDSRYIYGVKAFAGCGKSTLLKEITNEYTDKNFLGVAFNRDIVKENQSKFPANTSWQTMHGQAKSILTEVINKTSLNLDFKNVMKKVRELDIANALELKNKNRLILAKYIINAYEIFCNSSISINDLSDIEKFKYAATVQNNTSLLLINDQDLHIVCEYMKKLWILQESNKFPLTFNFYLKYYEQRRFATGIKNIDLILLDEAQDSNPVTISILNQINAPQIRVGDDHQSIYQFRGTINSLDICKEKFTLSNTFRYSQEIADIANLFLYKYKNETTSIKSKAENVYKDKSKALLVRNNSSLIEVIEDLLAREVEFIVLKKPSDVFACAISIAEFMDNEKITSDDYRFIEIQFKNYEELVNYIIKTDDSELNTANKLQKRMGKKKLKFLCYKANESNKKNKNNINAVNLTTAHSSKGLEWGEVKLYKDFPKFKKIFKKHKIEGMDGFIDEVNSKSKLGIELIQEVNLTYVSYTRAKSNLIYNDENLYLE